MNVKFHRITSYTWNFQNFTCVITILVKFDIHFLWLPWEIFFGVTTDDLLHLKSLKNVKKNAIFLKLFWYKVFVHWKLKLLNFLVDSVLNKLDNWVPRLVLPSGQPGLCYRSFYIYNHSYIEQIQQFSVLLSRLYKMLFKCFQRKTFHYSSI